MADVPIPPSAGLQLPPNAADIPVPAGAMVNANEPVPVRYVQATDKDWGALVFNIASVLLICCLISLAARQKTSSPIFTVAMPLGLIWVYCVYKRPDIWTSVPSREAYAFQDSLISKKVTVYAQGGHFVRWTSTKQPDVISFKKHQVISCKKDTKSEIRFPTRDGYEIEADLTIMFRRRDNEEALSRSLRFDINQLEVLIKATVVARLSDLGGYNDYNDILQNKVGVKRFVAVMFGGERAISEFEEMTGTEILDPLIENVDLTPESKQIFNVNAKARVIAKAIEILVNAGVSADEAAKIAQATEGAATRIIHTYEGVPQGAKVVALGNEGIAIAGKGGK